MPEQILITPDTKVGELLAAYPELEEVLIAQAPAFRKLANPVLRRTVARVATLTRVAEVGRLDVHLLVNTLRAAVGQPLLRPAQVSADSTVPPANLPDWAADAEIAETVNADDFLARGEHPLAHVSAAVQKLQPGQCVQLLSSFRPAPLIEKMGEQGFRVVSIQRSSDRHETYIATNT